MVTKIPNASFCNCTHVTNVIVPSTVVTLDANAFSGCSQLTLFNCTNQSTINNIKRHVKCSNFGSGSNAIHRIDKVNNSTTYLVVDDMIASDGQNDSQEIPVSTIPKNFIYYHGDNWKARNIVLVDDTCRFFSPEHFTADQVTYTRDLTDGNRSTLCLPFNAEKPADLDVYTFADYNSSTQTIRFQELQGHELTAYTPYLVGYGISQAKTNCEIIQENALFPATPTPIATSTINGLTFHGTMERECMNSTNYGYKDGYFVQSSAGTQGDHTSHAHVNPFRCYFTLSGSQNAPATLSVDTDGDYLGIEEVDGNMEQTAIRYSKDVYDMMGRLVRKDAESLRGLPRGIYIWRGKKQIAY